MAECAYCKAETQLYDRDVPICTQCAEARDGSPRKLPTSEQNIRTHLLQEVLEATARTGEAAREFEAVTGGQFPSGLPHPDGAQQIKSASQNLTVARKALMKAHHRLSNYHDRGIVPEDLKRSG
jgi:hypothetical protein